MIKKNRGAALLQVLMITALLAGLAVMVLRAVLSRQVTARQGRHAVAVHQAVEACMAEVNTMWALMTPEQYKESLDNCTMPPMKDEVMSCAEEGKPAQPAKDGEWYCRVTPIANGTEYCVTAKMEPVTAENKAQAPTESPCQITYTVTDGVKL